ncbi:putative protein [Arabidopsis thaliana]|uniref:Uncharacterized protein T22D6_160 n=3 Tax=Arabidopsis TaxID=3701 RepID=Q9LEY5_ARATH|nr:hypothetical protein ISN45_At05g007490 [Arabidopsis thaliana x Arabidopsis arenosa]KAG7608529.1 hypothetical protein ISN44_As05g007490 [Arabidopsis suecica]CAB93723.1 putative protein [Arabidopsis thaliana]
MTDAFLSNCHSIEPVLQEYPYRYFAHCLSRVYTFGLGLVEMSVLVGQSFGVISRVLGNFVEPEESSKVIGN